jgi:hypothetical protein
MSQNTSEVQQPETKATELKTAVDVANNKHAEVNKIAQEIITTLQKVKEALQESNKTLEESNNALRELNKALLGDNMNMVKELIQIQDCIKQGIRLELCDLCDVILPEDVSQPLCGCHSVVTFACVDCRSRQPLHCEECKASICEDCDRKGGHLCQACRGQSCLKHLDLPEMTNCQLEEEETKEDEDEEDELSESEVYCQEEHLPESGQCQYCQPDKNDEPQPGPE